METRPSADRPDVMAYAFAREQAPEDGGGGAGLTVTLPAPTPADAATSAEEAPARKILVLAPVGRDGLLAVSALASAGISAVAVDGPADLLRTVSAEIAREGPPEVGALLVTDDALGIDWSGRLVDVLERQPPWSDLPIVLLAGALNSGEQSWPNQPHGGAVAARLTAGGSVTVLDRPVRVAALVSAVRAALRARARQVEVRDLIESRDRALAEAERANRAKSAFLALMSHELRTPLNAIAGYVQLIDSGIYGPVTDGQREALSRVVRAEQHLLAIINDLLDFARIESGRIQYHSERVALKEAIAEAVGLVETQLGSKGLTCTTRLSSKPVLVMADPERLRQILLNLLSNAAKFTPSGGGITIEVDDSSPHNGSEPRLCVHVRDTGIGIPADKMDAIFEPFVQVDRERSSENQQGTGLGLPISRQLARAMGGDLTASSTPGEGSTFTLTVPRCPD